MSVCYYKNSKRIKRLRSWCNSIKDNLCQGTWNLSEIALDAAVRNSDSGIISGIAWRTSFDQLRNCAQKELMEWSPQRWIFANTVRWLAFDRIQNMCSSFNVNDFGWQKHMGRQDCAAFVNLCGFRSLEKISLPWWLFRNGQCSRVASGLGEPNFSH